MTSPTDALWQRALAGDRDAFDEALAPHHDTLLDAARRKLDARLAQGDLREHVLTAEGLAGATLVRAFDNRARYNPEQMSLRAWLLGLQHRELARIVRSEKQYDAQKAISLNAEVPATEEQDAVEQDFYEFYQPFDVTTYDEMIPSQQPADVEIDASRSLTPDERGHLEASGLAGEQREILEFHDEFALSLPEIAQIMEYSLQGTAEALGEARVHLRQYIGSTDADEVTDDSPIDSYTGEPIRDNPAHPASSDSSNDNAPNA